MSLKGSYPAFRPGIEMPDTMADGEVERRTTMYCGIYAAKPNGVADFLSYTVL